jgi:hypothetical protein
MHGRPTKQRIETLQQSIVEFERYHTISEMKLILSNIARLNSMEDKNLPGQLRTQLTGILHNEHKQEYKKSLYKAAHDFLLLWAEYFPIDPDGNDPILDQPPEGDNGIFVAEGQVFDIRTLADYHNRRSLRAGEEKENKKLLNPSNNLPFNPRDIQYIKMIAEKKEIPVHGLNQDYKEVIRNENQNYNDYNTLRNCIFWLMLIGAGIGAAVEIHAYVVSGLPSFPGVNNFFHDLSGCLEGNMLAVSSDPDVMSAMAVVLGVGLLIILAICIGIGVYMAAVVLWPIVVTAIEGALMGGLVGAVIGASAMTASKLFTDCTAEVYTPITATEKLLGFRSPSLSSPLWSSPARVVGGTELESVPSSPSKRGEGEGEDQQQPGLSINRGR